MANIAGPTFLMADGTAYGRRKNFCPFSVPEPSAYIPFPHEARIERLRKAAESLKGLKLLELSATTRSRWA